MASLILFVLGVAAPLAAALAVMWLEDRRRSYLKMRFERVTQDNRGLKLALSSKDANSTNAVRVPANVDAREVNRLLDELAGNGILFEWLKLGVKSPTEASARLMGVREQDRKSVV